MVDYMINKNKVMNKKEIELFFDSMLENATMNGDGKTYLELPDSNCFNYCLKEIIHILKYELENGMKRYYSHRLIKNFYKYMLDDFVLEKIDSLKYRELMINLKEYSESSGVSIKDQYLYFKDIDGLFGKKYKEKVFELINEGYEEEQYDITYYYKLFKVFINELLAGGIEWKYLGYIYKKNHEKSFDSFKEFIGFLHNANGDSYDIYLPLENVIDKNISFLEKNGQKIENINDKFYCKVYFNNCIDFYSVINNNMSRIDAIFNMLRLYSKSKIDFDYSERVIVRSKYFALEEEIDFKEIMTHVGHKPYYKHMENVIGSLESLKENNKLLYHRLLNIISYAEKDKDICNYSSYVDNWSSLETLCSLSGRKTGFESVLFIVPKVIASRLIGNHITTLLRNGIHRKDSISLEMFIDKVVNSADGEINTKNLYYEYRIKKYAKILGNLQCLKNCFEDVEDRIETDILRIYILRNQYVHESNIDAFKSMHQILLKNILPMMLDAFFKMMNNINMKRLKNILLENEIFTQLIGRYEIRNVAFKVLTEKTCRIGNNINIATDLEKEEIDLKDLVFNIIKGNRELFKKYDSKIEYKKKMDQISGPKYKKL